MNPEMNRRHFIKHSSTATAMLVSSGALSLHNTHAQGNTSNKIRVGVMGLSRGMAHVNNAVSLPNVEVAYVCDVDQQRIDRAIDVVDKKTPLNPKECRISATCSTIRMWTPS